MGARFAMMRPGENRSVTYRCWASPWTDVRERQAPATAEGNAPGGEKSQDGDQSG